MDIDQILGRALGTIQDPEQPFDICRWNECPAGHIIAAALDVKPSELDERSAVWAASGSRPEPIADVSAVFAIAGGDARSGHYVVSDRAFALLPRIGDDDQAEPGRYNDRSIGVQVVQELRELVGDVE